MGWEIAAWPSERERASGGPCCVPLQVRALRVGDQTTLAAIARLVSSSQASKAPVQVCVGEGDTRILFVRDCAWCGV